ncbi:hypothetical protein [Actinoplanes siamensis]|uniref:Uncharacterized protein n=1 Tax=Actinoplanes siamensis TaxID=1223317 RepID=A0A919TJM3_9ACTN|nr:hypothetical protein [Actinoplanes siamensis]GIF04658.1 hypothetical protein Asi03nite_21960 [Actinoplanes siamensis]
MTADTSTHRPPQPGGVATTTDDLAPYDESPPAPRPGQGGDVPVKATWTHGRAARHPGAVCGADDGPGTGVTGESSLVTFPDCPDAAETELIPDDASTGDPHIMQPLREAATGDTRKIDGVVVDATTPSAILTVYDAATPKTQVKIASLPPTLMASLAWNILNAERVGAAR